MVSLLSPYFYSAKIEPKIFNTMVSPVMPRTDCKKGERVVSGAAADGDVVKGGFKAKEGCRQEVCERSG